jgi:hypothetical protein
MEEEIKERIDLGNSFTLQIKRCFKASSYKKGQS